ncbi:MAG TPA: Ig domain-containing protein [Acidimicrobiales bacterium]|nr:Ig domain-containing protein [Acidimicrobiales bacterium]
MRRLLRGTGLLALAVAALTVGVPVVAGASGATTPAGTAGVRTAQGPSDVRAFMTLYGWADNSPPGPDIAHGCIHATAGGVGSYTDPITFATDVAELGWCVEIYVPYMQRYFIHEDECSQCDADWNAEHLYRFDMWAGGDAAAVHQPEKKALLHCESTWTRADSVTDPDNPTVIVDPPSGLPVTTAPVFSPTTGCWPGPVGLADPGKQTTVAGTAVSLQLRGTDTDTGQTLGYSAAALPPGLSLDRATGRIAGTPTVPCRRTVTVTAADAENSVSQRFVWVVRRR